MYGFIGSAANGLDSGIGRLTLAPAPELELFLGQGRDSLQGV